MIRVTDLTHGESQSVDINPAYVVYILYREDYAAVQMTHGRVAVSLADAARIADVFGDTLMPPKSPDAPNPREVAAKIFSERMIPPGL